MREQHELQLIELEKKLIQYLLTPNKPTNQILEHIFSSGGKRIRPTLFLLCCNLLNYSSEHVLPIASVCEYIHTASLLHDDVIDNSTLRRNKPTTNSIWGDETAILIGDLIYSAACRLMVRTKNLNLIDCFAECIRSMSESELYQLEMLWNINIHKENYFKIIDGKTANLFEACCLTPAFLAESSSEIVESLSQFGKYLGYAFQIADDCLDYSSQEKKLGKPVGTDLTEGKITLPLIYALEQNNTQLSNLVSKIIETNQCNEEEKKELLFLVEKLGGLEKAKNKAKEYSSLAKGKLNKIKNILTIKEPEKQNDSLLRLNQMADFSISRSQ